MTTEYQPGLRALLCTEDGGVQPKLDPDDIDQFIAVEGNLLWLDVDTAITRDVGLLKREFGFHDLALEDALRPHQRAKIEAYGGHSFLIFYTVSMRQRVRREFQARRRSRIEGDDARGTAEHEASDRALDRDLLTLHQISIFAGSNYLVTVHHGPLPELEEVADRWRQNIEQIDRSIGALVYSLLDTIVDGYFPVIDRMADVVEDLEEAIFEHFDVGALEDIFTLKKAMLKMRRAVAPERDVLNVLIRRDAPLFGQSSLIYFQDVYDHLVRVGESLDIYRDLLSSALDAYLSVSSNRLNEVMKTLTSWTIPLMAGALLAGIWGMNFEHMPELGWRYGYPMALSLIALSIVAIAAFFRRRRWL